MCCLPSAPTSLPASQLQVTACEVFHTNTDRFPLVYRLSHRHPAFSRHGLAHHASMTLQCSSSRLEHLSHPPRSLVLLPLLCWVSWSIGTSPPPESLLWLLILTPHPDSWPSCVFSQMVILCPRLHLLNCQPLDQGPCPCFWVTRAHLYVWHIWMVNRCLVATTKVALITFWHM